VDDPVTDGDEPVIRDLELREKLDRVIVTEFRSAP
jgi:hypothetical protein